ncbi:MAG: hypothetical protein R3330_12375, partial [Saprospiraceae bacterium]|nr:hypothetical protein [Saprospiraceae bacterium]
CLIDGPATICEGGTAILSLTTSALPDGVETPDIASILWSGPGITGAAQGTTIEVDQPGMYTAEVRWLTALGDTCLSSCMIELTGLPASAETIDILIVQGDTVEINDEIFTEGGQYLQVLTAENGCDSLLTINITALQTVVSFDLDGCRSYIDDGSNMDYSEFIPSYPQPLSCAQAEASILFREDPEVNRHSCTPGVNDTPAMCISSVDSCTFIPGSAQALVFEVTLSPAPDTAVALTGLTFFERAPEMFDWIDGPDGLNNYPTHYAVRVLKDGSEIFRVEDQPTALDWHQVALDFLGIPQFIVNEETTFSFELLGYCLIGNGAPVAAWDLDEIRVEASCASPSDTEGLISGTVRTPAMVPIPDVAVHLAGLEERICQTDESGQYTFQHNKLSGSYQISAAKEHGILEGVSTLDLIRIQKHLLGTNPFTSPFQYLAADINRSNSISTSDLLELRRLLLGLQKDFSQNTSWRFGDAYQDLVISDPWHWEESIAIDHLTGDATQQDMIGVKVG